MVHHRAGRLDDAERTYAKVLEIVPAHPGALNMQGLLALQRGNAAAALELFDRAISAGGDGAGVFLNRGNALRALQRRVEAIASYDRALHIDPRMAGAHVNRGNVLRDDGRLEEAAAAYHAALAVDPSSFAAAANASAVLAQMPGQGDEAVLAACRVAIELASQQGLRGPDVANCHNAVGIVHRRAGRVDEAIASLRSACEHDDKFAQAHFNLAGVFTDAAQYGNALESLQVVRQLDPDLPGFFELLALTLRRLGRDADAALVYREWADREPSNPIPTHMARALSGETPPDSASAEYVRREFDTFAANFDKVLQTKLGYRAPDLVEAKVRAALGEGPRGLDVADLGCGTGLCGKLLRPFAARLVGIDLSPKMLEFAQGRGYDELVVDDIVSYCRARPRDFDLLVAADVLVYIGDLRPLFAAARLCLRGGGHIVFTVERAEDQSSEYRLNVGGRFMHSERYVRAMLAEAGFSVLDASVETLRTELAKPVNGLVVVARAD